MAKKPKRVCHFDKEWTKELQVSVKREASSFIVQHHTIQLLLNHFDHISVSCHHHAICHMGGVALSN